MSSKFFAELFLLLIFTFSIPREGLCQNNKVIKGVVTSADDHLPVAFATINLKFDNSTVTTNEEGKFSIVIKDDVFSKNDTLTISCIGYKGQSLIIPKNEKEIKVSLAKSTIDLKEVVIRPLSLRQLLDSIKSANSKFIFNSVQYNGYYNELVYTNNKCTEFSDALFSYFVPNKPYTDGAFKIIASRCLKEKKVNNDKNNMEVYSESKLNPNQIFNYALFNDLLDKYLPTKNLSNYDYKFEESKESSQIKLTIFSRNPDENSLYQLIIYTSEDFKLDKYHLEVPEKNAILFQEKSLLGLHSRNTKLLIEATFKRSQQCIYPSHFYMIRAHDFWGKFMGTNTNEHVINKSEFIVSSIVSGSDVHFPSKNETYKKGNLCANGIAINSDLLSKYNTIPQTSKDSISLSLLQPPIN